MDLIIRPSGAPPPGQQAVEVVERKGLGHPDSICDALAEEVCVRLCRLYTDRFGMILHHNVDKILLCAGAARPAFAGGEITAPIEVHLAGRVTMEHDGTKIPVAEAAVEACQDWLRAHLRLPDLDRSVRILPRFRPGSGELTQLFGRGERLALANDTSCGAGFAPLTDLERVVLAVERALNSREAKRAHPALGEDIKVMGIRRGQRIDLTIACAMIGRYLAGLDDYVKVKLVARELALKAAQGETAHQLQALVNAADDLVGSPGTELEFAL